MLHKLNFLAQIDAMLLNSAFLLLISYDLAKIQNVLTLQPSVRTGEPVRLSYSSKFLIASKAVSTQAQTLPLLSYREAVLMRSRGQLIEFDLLASILVLALEKLSSASFLLPALSCRSPSSQYLLPACLDCEPQLLMVLLSASFMQFILSSVLPVEAQKFERSSIKSAWQRCPSSSQQSLILNAYSINCLNSSLFYFFTAHARYDLVILKLKAEGGSSNRASQILMCLRELDSKSAGGVQQERYYKIAWQLLFRLYSIGIFLELSCSSFTIYSCIFSSFFSSRQAYLTFSINSVVNRQQLFTFGLNSTTKPFPITPYSLKAFFVLFNLLVSTFILSNLISELRKKPGIISELLIGDEYFLLKLRFNSFHASLLLLLLPYINSLRQSSTFL